MRRHVFLAHVAVAISGTICAFWAATQYVARAFQYHQSLGEPWFRTGTTPYYAPWSWLAWDLRFGQVSPDLFKTASWISYGTIIAVFGLLVLLAVFRMRNKSKSDAYGSARWATTRELHKTALIRDDGVVLCQTDDARFRTEPGPDGTAKLIATRFGQLVRHNGPEHVICFAPTRSGKGVGLVIPTLLSWTHSAIIWDVKRELWQNTAGWRRQFSHCWRFEPASPDSVRFNPLLEIRRATEVRDAQTIADMLVDPDGSKAQRDHWQMTAHTLLVGTILHVLYAEKDKSLAGIATFLSDPSRSQFDTLERMLKTPHLNGAAHPVIAGAAREMLNKSENELSGVFSTAMTSLGLYRDPIIARATSTSDFRISDLMHADHPASLYLVVSPGDISRTLSLIRLLINQIGRRLTESNVSGGGTPYKHRLLMMLDEFPTLGRLDFFETALAYLAGYGIKCFLICQDLKQLEDVKRYGPNNSIVSNCHVRQTYRANDDYTAERISRLLGQATETKEQRSFGGNRLAPWLGHVTDSVQELARPLLTPGEVLQLPEEDALLFAGGLHPYRAKKVVFYQDQRFKERSKLAAPNSPEEQERELLPVAASEWNTILEPALDSPEAASAVHPEVPVSHAKLDDLPSNMLVLTVPQQPPAPAAQQTAAATESLAREIRSPDQEHITPTRPAEQISATTNPPDAADQQPAPTAASPAPPPEPQSFDEIWNSFLPGSTPPQAGEIEDEDNSNAKPKPGDLPL